MWADSMVDLMAAMKAALMAGRRVVQMAVR
jgi:hypothetical protein